MRSDLGFLGRRHPGRFHAGRREALRSRQREHHSGAGQAPISRTRTGSTSSPAATTTSPASRLSNAPDWKETFRSLHARHAGPGEDPRDGAPPSAWDRARAPGCGGDRRRAQGRDGDILFLKHWFDVFTNANVLPVLNALAPARIVLYGVALDVCDRYAVEGLLKHRHDIRLSLVTDAVRAIHDDQSAALLRGWEQRGVQLVTSAQVLAA